MKQMHPGLLVISASLLGLLITSSTLVVHVYATNYQGNDDAEFDCTHNYSSACTPNSGFVIGGADISTSITYTPAKSYVSLQYNPDRDISNSYQSHDSAGQAQWFQTW